MCSCDIITPANSLTLQKHRKSNIYCIYCFECAKAETDGVFKQKKEKQQQQQPSPRMQGWDTTMLTFETYVFLPFYLSVSHTLFSQRCCTVTHKGKIPFPSNSGRLQRSIIRVIYRTGPISCLVPFESAKLLWTSKKESVYLGFNVLKVQRSNTYNQNEVSTPKWQHLSLTHRHTHTCTHNKGNQLFGWRKTVQMWCRICRVVKTQFLLLTTYVCVMLKYRSVRLVKRCINVNAT